MPFSFTLPRVGSRWPDRTASRVLLPLPLGPMMQSISPRFTSKLMWSSARESGPEVMDQILHLQRLDQGPLLVEKPLAESAAHRLAAGKPDQRTIPAASRCVCTGTPSTRIGPWLSRIDQFALRALRVVADEQHGLGRQLGS